MNKIDLHLKYDKYDSASTLDPADKELLQKALDTTANAYAPYSKFRVGAAARMKNGEIIFGTNQENASFPVGICAERVLLSVAATLYPGVAIDSIAIGYINLAGESNRPITPCGICRQSLREYEERTNRPIRLILGGSSGPVLVMENISTLLPLSFGGSDLGAQLK